MGLGWVGSGWFELGWMEWKTLCGAPLSGANNEIDGKIVRINGRKCWRMSSQILLLCHLNFSLRVVTQNTGDRERKYLRRITATWSNSHNKQTQHKTTQHIESNLEQLKQAQNSLSEPYSQVSQYNNDESSNHDVAPNNMK